MIRLMLAMVVLAVAVALGGCSATSPTSTGGAVSQAQVTPPAPLTSAAPSPATIQTATFGQRFTLPTGLAIEVAQPEVFKPSKTASGAEGARAVMITATLVNGSATPFDFNQYIVGPKVVHGGQAATQIFDTAKKIGVGPVVKILPGKSLTFRTAFALQAEPGEMQLEFSPGFGEDPAIFVGTV